MDKVIISAGSSTQEIKPAQLLQNSGFKARLENLWSNYRSHLLVIALYALTYLILTWPLALHFTDQSLMGFPYVAGGVPDDRDQFIWDTWWLKKALLDFRVNPYHTNFLYYPYGVDLYLQSLTPINGLLSLPFQGWLGVLGAYNVVCFILFVWCGHAAYLLADYLLKHKIAAFVTGFFFTFSATHLANLFHAQFNVIALQFVPLYLLYLFKLDQLNLASWRERLSSKRWWLYTVLAAFFLVFSTVSDQYLLFYCLATTLLYFLWRGLPSLLSRRSWPEIFKLISNLLPTLLLAGLIMSPFLFKTWQTINSGQWSKVSNWPIPTDLFTILLPPGGNSLFGSQASTFGSALPIRGAPRDYNSVGLVTILVGIYGLARCKSLRFWGVVALVSFILALGGDLQIGGNVTGILLPAKLLSEIPVVGVMRYSQRWLAITTLALAIGVGGAIWFHWQNWRDQVNSVGKLPVRFKQFGLVLLVLGLFAVEIQPWPFELSGQQDQLPQAYAEGVLPKTDQRALLELPILQKNVAKNKEMYWQTAHERPMLGGYLSRPYSFSYSDTPFAYFLDLSSLDQADFVKASGPDLKHFLDYYNFGYIALYKTKTAPNELEQWRKFVAKLGPEVKLYHEDSELVLYQLSAPDAQAAKTPLLLRGNGWSGIEKLQDGSPYRWITEKEAGLWFVVPQVLAPGSQYHFHFQAAAYYRERTLNVLVNGQPVTQLKIGQVLQPYDLSLDAKWFKSGENSITLDPLEPPDRPSLVEKVPTKDNRPLTIFLSQLEYKAG